MVALSFRRFSLLLLASSASALALNAGAVAAPFNPAGLSPAVLFPVTEAATGTLIRTVATQTPRRTFTNMRLLPLEQHDTTIDFGLKTLFGDDQSNSTVDGLSFSTTDLPGASSVTVRQAKLALRPTLDATFDNAAHGIRFG